jgi:hypothetical protein
MQLVKHKQTTPYVGLILLTAAACFVLNARAEDALTTVDYRGSSLSDPNGHCGLLNPERGLRIETIIAEPEGAQDVWGPAHHLVGRLTPAYSDDWWIMDAERYAPFGLTLVQAYCYLDKFMAQPVLEEKLTLLQRSLDALRARGLKALLRFAYEKEMNQAEGPALETLLGHMAQLAPVLEKNKDVIYVLQAGFVGAWGEWHSSAQHLEQDHANLAAIMAKLLEILPPDRMTQVRVPKYKRWILESPLLNAYQVINPETAFSGIPAARIGFHNDGFLAGNTCGGTWTEAPLFSSPGNPEFDYMTTESLFVPVDGELFWSDISGRVDGFQAAVRMRLHHYTSFSLAHSYSEREGATYGMDIWMKTFLTREQAEEARLPVSDGYFQDLDGAPVPRTQFDYIRDHLGYRLELQRASYAATPRAGSPLQLELVLINRGFATLINPRPVLIALISSRGAVHTFELPGVDVRRWYPHQPGDATYAALRHTLTCGTVIPENLAPGWYSIGLWLPDASEGLRLRPEYAVRVANANVPFWTSDEGLYGINLLGTVQVLPGGADGRP